MRYFITVMAAVLSLSPLHAGGESLAGNWKVTIYEDGQYLNFWLLKMESKDGKLTGEATSMTRVPPTKVPHIEVNGDLVNLTLQLANGAKFKFEGKLPKAGAKKIYGSITRGGPFTPAYLEATQAKNTFEANRETLTRGSSLDPKVFSLVLELIGQAKENKVPIADVKEWIEPILKASEQYGPSWHLDFGNRLVEALAGSYPSAAADVGQQLAANLGDQAPLDLRMRVLTGLSGALAKAGKADEAAKIDRLVEKLEVQSYEAYAAKGLPYKTEKYSGKGGRPVLVELFTGAQCPPCVAADMAFDGLENTFGKDVVLLQYHMHIPGPDALTNPDNEARGDYYGKSFRGTPAIYFGGKPLAPGGGGKDDAGEKYREYRDVIEELLKKAPGAEISATATRKGDDITIAAEVTGVAMPGPKVKLRFALVEDWARYQGRNGLTFHHQVVRGMPGGPAGFAVEEKSLKKSVSINLAEIRKGLAKYLDDFAKNESPFLDAQRPLQLRNLHVVAFVQDDATQEVLQAVRVPVKE